MFHEVIQKINLAQLFWDTAYSVYTTIITVQFREVCI